jgi:hypothetical protein
MKNTDIGTRAMVLGIERILQNVSPQVYQELQRKIGVIGPLDGNLPPTRSIDSNLY